jgi:hypothetical protein
MASILTPTQIAAAGVAFANWAFPPTVTANLNTTQIQAALTALDAAMAMTPAEFASTYGNSANVGAAIGAAAFGAVSGLTETQAAAMLVFWVQQVVPGA